MTRTIEAPGIQNNEIDRSNYERTQDYSIVETTALALGFADKGNDYSAEWINTMQTFEQLYGIPTNEIEQYFYNAAAEQIGRGGVFVGMKLPYDNSMKDNYKYVDYSVSISSLANLTSLSDLISISSSFDTSKPIAVLSCLSSSTESIEDLDDQIVGNKAAVREGTFRIVDITHQKYSVLQKPSLNAVQSEIKQLHAEPSMVWTNECLGLVPIVVTPTNAMIEQGIVQSNSISAYNAVGSMEFEVADSSFISAYPENIVSCLSMPMSSDDTNSMTLSKTLAKQFPTISYDSEYQLEQSTLGLVMVVVMQAYQDPSNDNNISFKLLEKHVGSLDKTAKDSSGKSLFIDDIINDSSSCIKFFSKVNPRQLQTASTSYICNQAARSLGFFMLESRKLINANAVQDKIKKALAKCSNQNTLPLDLVVDAGITNIAQLVDRNAKEDVYTGKSCINFDVESRVKDYLLKLESKEDSKPWLAAYKLLDSFCKETRKDCMLIGDAPRALCLNGDQKLVRDTRIGSSVTTEILPKLKYIANKDLNSSYSACYCNWFLVPDAKTSEYFWIPPSIKALGCYTYTDAYFHPWDAPAGMIRGRLQNVVDTAFTPNADEAGRLYSQGFNYAMNYPLDGIVLEGQKTMQLRKTAFDRINVRRLFLTIEKQIGRIGKYFLYQGNTEFTRQRFTDQCRSVLEAAVNGGGIAEYAIKCDATNNTPETIDRNELHCRIAAKPIKSIEFIVLDFICTNQSASVTEEVVK